MSKIKCAEDYPISTDIETTESNKKDLPAKASLCELRACRPVGGSLWETRQHMFDIALA